jgi:RimJ/RimL family protein N-acetyltransferase
VGYERLLPLEGIATERLRLRPFQPSDVEAFIRYRTDPTTTQWQSWTLPLTAEKATEIVTSCAKTDRLIDGEWTGFVITDATTNEIFGDISFCPDWKCRSAELGYTLGREHRGRGIVTEAAAAVIAWLFSDAYFHRVHAALHPDNHASAAVLERLGFVYEGTLVESFWVDDDCSDDPQYRLLRTDWVAWNDRPRYKPETVELVEVTADNLDDVYLLATHRSQERFVAPVPRSLAQILLPKNDDAGGRIVPWYRAVVADGDIVGFVLLMASTPTSPDPYLWRLLIDRMHQRRGIGRRVLDLVVRACVDGGDTYLDVCFKEGVGSPAPLYLGYGFVPTGEVIDDEIVARLALSKERLSTPAGPDR